MPNDTLSKSSCPRQLGSAIGSEWLDRRCLPLLELLFPPVCTLCAVPLGGQSRRWQLCDACGRKLVKGKSSDFCSGCGLPLPVSGKTATKCPGCVDGANVIDQVVPLGVYEGELRRAVIRAKQFHEYPLAATLGGLLAEKLAEAGLSYCFDVAIPIPKYWMKRITRAATTSEVLVEVIGGRLHLPTAAAALSCQRMTSKQSLLRMSQRQRNVRGSMRVTTGFDLRDARVLLVDDIMTTGSTAREAAHVLRRGGARWVTLAVVARAIVERRGT